MSEHNDNSILDGYIVDETVTVTITDLCRSCAIESDQVAELVDEGILEPIDTSNDEWCFSYASLKRTRTVIRLQRDLGVNLAGAALAIELLERIDSLQRSG